MKRSKGKARRPKSEFRIRDTKSLPKVAAPSKKSDMMLAWKFENTDSEGPFGWSQLAESGKALEVINKLREFEGKNWDQIKSGGSHRIGVNKLHSSAQVRLQKLGMDQFDELISLRLTGKNRAWAFWWPQHENILRLLWWDPEHQVYPVEKDKADRKKRKRRR